MKVFVVRIMFKQNISISNVQVSDVKDGNTIIIMTLSKGEIVRQAVRYQRFSMLLIMPPYNARTCRDERELNLLVSALAYALPCIFRQRPSML